MLLPCLIALVCGVGCLTASAKVERTKVYMFGFSASFTDSLVYMTDIQELDSAWINSKSDFLIDRPIYSDQFQTYLKDKIGVEECTSVIFFNTKRKKLEEEFKKVKKRYEADPLLVMKWVTKDNFKFKAPVYYGSDNLDHKQDE